MHYFLMHTYMHYGLYYTVTVYRKSLEGETFMVSLKTAKILPTNVSGGAKQLYNGIATVKVLS